VTALLKGRQYPLFAATDYVRAYADQIRAFISAHYTVLRTDGFGRSDTRENLRRFFVADQRYIAHVDAGDLALERLLDPYVRLYASGQSDVRRSDSTPRRKKRR